MSNIWAAKGLRDCACCKIPYKGYEISIAMDDSCGALADYSRSNIRVWRDFDGSDVTAEFYKVSDHCDATAENLKHIFSMIDMFVDRD